jgi:hypothetical protein
MLRSRSICALSINHGRVPRAGSGLAFTGSRLVSRVEKSFRRWRNTLAEIAEKHDDDAKRFTLNDLRKRAR